MPLRWKTTFNCVLILTVLGFMLEYVVYANKLFNSTTRWLYLLVLIFILLVQKKYIYRIERSFFIILVLYLSWCFFSSFWSNDPFLTFLKSILFVIVTFTMISAGIEWVRVNRWMLSLNYLRVFSFIVIAAALLGKINSIEISNPDAVSLYTGSYVLGSNGLGFYLAIAFPFVLWNTYLAKKSKNKFYFWVLVLIIDIFFLLATMSRGAISVAIMTLIGFVASLNLGKKTSILIFISLIGSILLTLFPEKTMDIVNTYANKSYSKGGIFSSREKVWEQSYNDALEGGWFGLGYGVSAEETHKFSFEHGLSTCLYGREKGNSQLPIVEETGIIGLAMYLALIVYLLNKIIYLFIVTQYSSQKILLGIVSGTIVGMIVQSCVEGWWDAPGGSETVCFWLLIGILRGLEISFKNVEVNIKKEISIDDYRLTNT